MDGRIARIGAVLVGLSLGLGVVGCGKKAVPPVDLSTAEPRVVLLAEQHELADVRGAIIGAMQDRGWVAEQESGTDITARLSHKGATVRVVIQYAVDRVSIKGLMAEGAGRNYDRWMANLESSFRDRLKKPAPVATPAATPAAATPAPTMAVFDAKQQPENVKGVLQRALAQHSWVIEKEDADGALIARLSHRKGLLRVRIVADVTQATITYLDSQGLDLDATGRSPDYEKWVRNLVEAIRASTRAQPVPVATPAATPAAAVPAPTLAVFDAKQPPQKVKGVLQRALAQHSWVIEKEEADGAIIARLSHRKGLLRVRIVADVTQATITYLDSQGLDLDATGRSTDYEKWMRNLVDAIRTNTRA